MKHTRSFAEVREAPAKRMGCEGSQRAYDSLVKQGIEPKLLPCNLHFGSDGCAVLHRMTTPTDDQEGKL